VPEADIRPQHSKLSTLTQCHLIEISSATVHRVEVAAGATTKRGYNARWTGAHLRVRKHSATENLVGHGYPLFL
jgi:hypothetical protein